MLMHSLDDSGENYPRMGIIVTIVCFVVVTIVVQSQEPDLLTATQQNGLFSAYIAFLYFAFGKMYVSIGL